MRSWQHTHTEKEKERVHSRQRTHTGGKKERERRAERGLARVITGPSLLRAPLLVDREGPEDGRLVGTGGDEREVRRVPAGLDHLVGMLGHHDAGQRLRQVPL